MKKPRADDEARVLEALAEAIAPAPLDPARRDAMRRRVQERVGATRLAGTRTLRAGEGEWRAVLPGIEMRILHRDAERGRQTALYRMRPGAELPTHPHADDEECLVLEGEVSCGDLRLHAGDYHFAAAGSVHPPLVSRPGALLLLMQALHA